MTAATGAKRDWREQVSDWCLDLRHSGRSLARTPGVTTVIVVMLALGIGASTAMFGILDTLFLSPPLHVVDATGVIRLWLRENSVTGQQITHDVADYSTYAALSGLHSVASVAAYTPPSMQLLDRGPSSRRAKVSAVTGGFFAFLGVRQFAGRLLTGTDDSASAVPVAIVSYGYWKRHFAGRVEGLGSTIMLDDVTYTVVGIAPSGFSGPEPNAADIWVPVQIAGAAARGPLWRDGNAGGVRLVVLARPLRGVSASAVADEATNVLRASRADQRRNSGVQVLAGSILPDRKPGGVSKGSQLPLAVGGVAAVVLLIACANATNLLLLRAARRRREIAVRHALGAAGWRLVRPLVIESVILAVAAGLAAAWIAEFGTSVLQAALVPQNSWAQSGLGVRSLVFTAAIVLVIGLLVGVTSAWQAGRSRSLDDLKAGPRAARVTRSTTRGVLVVGQAALSLTLLVGAALFLRSFLDARRIHLGFDLDRLLIAELQPEDRRNHAPVPDGSVGALADRVRRLPGVVDVAISTNGLMSSWGGAALQVPGLNTLPRGGMFYANAVSPNYFEVAGIRLVRGRSFTRADRPGTARVAVVNQTMASVLWPGEDALTKCLMVGPNARECTTVVGIVEDAHERGIGYRQAPMRQYYLPLAQESLDGANRTLLARSSVSPSSLVSAVSREVTALFPNLPRESVRTLLDLFEPQIRPWRVGLGLFGAAAALAMLLASVGLYSIVAFDVRLREHEIGIRRALGAETWRLTVMVLKRGAALVSAGLALGLALSVWGSRLLEPLLFEGRGARDPVALLLAVGVLGAASVAATVIPVQLAARADPLLALQAD